MPRPAGGTAIDRVRVVGPLFHELLALEVPPRRLGDADGTEEVLRRAEREHPGRVTPAERDSGTG